MAATGTYIDPASRSCFVQCTACFRCDRRRAGNGENCGGCSGRPDPSGFIDPHHEDICTCREGTLRWVTKNGRVIIRQYDSNPFQNKIDFKAESQDEVDWRAYVNEKREQYGIEDWDPIRVYNKKAR